MSDDAQAIRLQHVQARREAIRAGLPKREMVHVTPRDDDVRKRMHHPNGTAFPASGTAEWPNDRYTQRRVADGTVTIEAAGHGRHQHTRPTE